MAVAGGARTRRRLRALVLSGGVLAVGAGPALAATAGTYTGKTSQKDPVTAKVVGPELAAFSITWNATCQKQGSLVGVQTYHRNVAIRNNRWSVSAAYWPAKEPAGWAERFAVTDHGTFVSKSVMQGAFSATVRVDKVAAKTHKRTYFTTCTAKAVTFKLTRVT